MKLAEAAQVTTKEADRALDTAGRGAGNGGTGPEGGRGEAG